LRSELPMNIRAQRGIAVAPPLAADIQRIFELWSTSLSRYSDKGPWLLGEFSVVDAMFAPVAMRFLTYGITMPEDIANYVAHVDGDADMADWKDHALQEAWVVEADEAGADVVLD
jgi:glutathione S-transferase